MYFLTKMVGNQNCSPSTKQIVIGVRWMVFTGVTNHGGETSTVMKAMVRTVPRVYSGSVNHAL